MLEFEDIQGIIFSGYKNKTHATYLLLSIVDAAKARYWLRSISQLVTTGAQRPKETCMNVALTADGLAMLGLNKDAFQTFPLEFREGLAGSETRSRMLGDVGISHPTQWLWGGPSTRVHVLLMLYASTAELLQGLIDFQKSAYLGALDCVLEQSTQSRPDRREHFGFADGIAQPVIEGSESEARAGMPSIKAGEFILGYKNEYGKLPFIPNASPVHDVGSHLAECDEGGRKALGRNGSYLVVRQFEQDVHGFWSFMRKTAQQRYGHVSTNDAAIQIAAKVVGRWPSGAPLVESPDHDNAALAEENNFGYFCKDRHGFRCPIGAHIRRSNPRDSLEPDAHNSEKVVNRHRILRRGRSYGRFLEKPWFIEKDDGEKRGLLFICVNSNIRRQFEFVQQTWVNNPKFGGLYDERDALIGFHDESASSFTIPSEPTRHRITDLPRFVHVRGGEYFFLPSVRALRFLASLSETDHGMT